jgi:pyruvate,water dikinase
MMQGAYYDALGLTPAQINLGIGGYQPEIPVPAGSPYWGWQGWKRQWAGLKLARVVWRLARQFPREITALYAAVRKEKAINLAGQTNAGLLQLLQRVLDLGAALGPRFQLANAAAAVWQPPLERLLSWLAPGRVRPLVAALTAGSGKVTSAEHGYRLFDLAAAARRDPAAREYLSQTPLDPQGWRRLAPDSLFRMEMSRFLAEFGHRGLYEADLANPRWNEDPGYLLEQVRFLLATERTRPLRDGQATRRAAEAEVRQYTRWLRPLVFWLAARARQGAVLREAGKSAIVATLEPLRAAALEVGRRLVAAGALDDPSEVFHLATLEVETYLRGEWDGTGARALVADRKAQRDAWLAKEPPDVLLVEGDGPPTAWQPAARGLSLAPATIAAAASPSSTSSALCLTGMGVSSGRASGPACIVRHPAEGQRLQNGQVLVAPSTDPGWTPLFLRASAVVMEVGGYLSHGAIVAREYGLPAVVNIPGLLHAVREGQVLSVDGDAGQVRGEG